MDDLEMTPLYDLHTEHAGRMVPFAGYSMPVQYRDGIIAEHTWTRTKAGLFDVSHMGQIRLHGASVEAVALGLETLVPMDIAGLAEDRQRYALFTNDAGGILDDLMVANRGDHLCLVVNAACKADDIAHLTSALPASITVEPLLDRALIALQGPLAETALSGLVPDVSRMRFMDVATVSFEGHDLWISRSGYTGEDGFEMSVPETAAEALAQRLLDHDAVAPIGLGARDSLRLEAGLCLYGHDIDTSTTPVEAGLSWAIQKLRRPGGARAGGYPGAGRIAADLADGPPRRRVGLRPEGRAPVREDVRLYADDTSQAEIGHVTSGGFGPSIGAPVAMGYVAAGTGARVFGEVRGKRRRLDQAKLPFVAARFKR